MLSLFIFVSALIINCKAQGLIHAVRLRQLNPFPIELGHKLVFRITPVSGHTYDPSGSFNIFLDNDVIGSRSVSCKEYSTGIYKGLVNCEVERGSEISLFLTPLKSHYGRNLRIIFYRNQDNVYSHQGILLLNTSIQLTRQPTFLNMSIQLVREPNSVRFAPGDLNLSPPTFLQGSLAQVECKTDGALPPSPITFTISCSPPPRATVEHERRMKSNLGYPYSIHYRFYNFDSPPTDDELADRLAIEYARAVLEESRISTSTDNLTLSASLPISSKAHECSIYCRLQGKEEQIRLTVYYQTTLAYLLPAPKEGLMHVGSSMSCYADGFPNPSISLSLRQPLRQYRKEPIIEPNQFFVSTSPSPPHELVIDDSPIALSTRIGLRPDEYTIRGGRFTLAYNATVGVELLLVCTARNALPNAIDFLGENKTITTARFVVAAIINSLGMVTDWLLGILLLIGVCHGVMLREMRTLLIRGMYAAVSYSSIGIVVGICLAILLISIMIILLMVYLRRRQKYASDAINARTAVGGTNGLKNLSATDCRPNSRQHQAGDYPINKVMLVSPLHTQSLNQAVQESWARRNSNVAFSQVRFCDSINSLTYSLDDYSNCRHSRISSPKVQNKKLYEMRSSLVDDGSPKRDLLMSAFGPSSIASTSHSNQQRQPTPQEQGDGHDGVEYAELRFTATPAGTRKPQSGVVTLDRNASGRSRIRPLGPAEDCSSASLHHLPRGNGVGENEEASDYADIVGIMQPKAYASQLVLKQQQEATQTILAMHQSKPSVFV